MTRTAEYVLTLLHGLSVVIEYCQGLACRIVIIAAPCII